MDGSTRRLNSSTQRQPALQLRPQPRFVAPPAPPTQAVNIIRPFVRSIPTPLPAVKAVPTMALPKLGVAGLAFGLGFFIGDALINPLLGQESVFDWGLFNSPQGSPDWQNEDPLPEGFNVVSVGEMGTEGASVTGSMVYEDIRVAGSDGCQTPVERTIDKQFTREVGSTGGQLSHYQEGPAPNGCGVMAKAVYVVMNAPSPGGTPSYKEVVGMGAGNFNPKGGIGVASFEIQYEPKGDPLGFLPTPTWEPVTQPRPQPEPEPQVEPLPEPRRTPVRPMIVPQAPPTTLPIPQPAPTPTIQPAPSPIPQTNPALVPNKPVTPVPTVPGTDVQQISNAGKLVPKQKPAVPTTPTDQHFPFSGSKPVNSGGVRPSLTAVAAEVGRIEQKVNQELVNTKDIPWWIIPGVLDLLSAFLEQDIPGTTYELTGVCETVGDGEDQPTAEFPVEPAKNLGAIINRLDVMDDMLQQHLAWRTPTCRTRPQLQGDWRTISFISDETSPFGKSRLRKRLRYRSVSGLGLGEIIDHWADFTWTAGPICVIHSGASWGTPQVWASSVDEGKRVILHAAGEAGIDPNQVGQWTVSGSSSPRVGVSGTMRVNQTGGYYWITARDGSENRPTVGLV